MHVSIGLNNLIRQRVEIYWNLNEVLDIFGRLYTSIRLAVSLILIFFFLYTTVPIRGPIF